MIRLFIAQYTREIRHCSCTLVLLYYKEQKCYLVRSKTKKKEKKESENKKVKQNEKNGNLRTIPQQIENNPCLFIVTYSELTHMDLNFICMNFKCNISLYS